MEVFSQTLHSSSRLLFLAIKYVLLGDSVRYIIHKSISTRSSTFLSSVLGLALSSSWDKGMHARQSVRQSDSRKHWLSSKMTVEKEDCIGRYVCVKKEDYRAQGLFWEQRLYRERWLYRELSLYWEPWRHQEPNPRERQVTGIIHQNRGPCS